MYRTLTNITQQIDTEWLVKTLAMILVLSMLFIAGSIVPKIGYYIATSSKDPATVATGLTMATTASVALGVVITAAPELIAAGPWGCAALGAFIVACLLAMW